MGGALAGHGGGAGIDIVAASGIEKLITRTDRYEKHTFHRPPPQTDADTCDVVALQFGIYHRETFVDAFYVVA